MTAQTVLDLVANALVAALKLAGPFLAAALIVGIVISIIQAATQIQEMTLQFIPKIIAMVVVLVIAGPWMLSQAVGYTQELLRSIPQVVRSK